MQHHGSEMTTYGVVVKFFAIIGLKSNKRKLKLSEHIGMEM